MRSEARKKAIQDAKRCEINNRTTAGKLRNILEGSYINGRFDCLLYFTKQLKMIKKSGKGKEFVDYLEESGILEKVKRNILSATNAKWQTSFKDETINEPSFKNCYQYEFLKAFIYTRMLELGEKEEKD